MAFSDRMKDLASKIGDVGEDIASKAGNTASDLGAKSLAGAKDLIGKVGDKAGDTLQDLSAKGLAGAKDLIGKVGSAASDLGTKGIAGAKDLGAQGKALLEVKQLENKAQKLMAQLGAEVYKALAEQKLAGISSTTPGIMEIFAQLDQLEKEIDKKEAAAKK